MEEIFKDIKGYEGMYQVSNTGKVKSLQRFDALNRIVKERILKHTFFRGYPAVALYDENGKRKNITIHKLMAIAFLNHKPCGYKIVIDHIDHNRANNHLSNLRLISQRKNTDKRHLRSSSKYIGVDWCKSAKKWRARILINNESKCLGLFANEFEAYQSYIEALKEFKSTGLVDKTISKNKPITTSRFIGVSWDNRDKKWISKMQVNGKRKTLGYYDDELEAAKAYIDAFIESTKDKLG
jgi:hypothetical protein